MTHPPSINIDSRFEAQIPPLTTDELASLEASILAEGCRDALVVWKEERLLLDGHHRLKICEKHGVSYRADDLSLPSREAAEDWIDAHQLGRRNLSPEATSLLRGRRYNRTKKSKAEAGAIGGTSKGHSDPCLETTADRLAVQHGVSPATVKRDGKFAAAVETLKRTDPDIEQRILAGGGQHRREATNPGSRQVVDQPRRP